jgi:hypothetical protein
MSVAFKTWAVGGLLACASMHAQMHKVAKPENVVRAVAVYEWTGDDWMKPVSSRLVPVSLFIDGKLQDADVYDARPVPFALQTGTIFELDQAGIAKGLVQLSYARHLQAVNPKGEATPYEDGWFGYGMVKPMPVPKPPAPAKHQSKAVVMVNGAPDDPDRPVLLRKSGSDSDTGSDPDRPALKRKGDDEDNPAPPDDPDRPVLKKKAGSSDSTDDTGALATDPDRPTLKKRPAQRVAADDDGFGGDATLNDDPNRPSLHRGKPVAALTEADLPKLTGLPPDLHQMVAVSDAVNRSPHDFTRPWESDAERVSVLNRMQELARAKVLAYAPAPAPTAAAKRRAASKAKANQGADVTFADEDLRGYLLSYGGLPTYVYTASAGPDKDGNVRYVWVVAQADGLGEMKAALSGATDAQHLDRTPRFRLVDVVDAEASNRASLLVELRAQNSRQFALYRVIGAQSQQIFATGTTQ